MLRRLADYFHVTTDYLLGRPEAGRDAPEEQKEKPADFGRTDKEGFSDDERELLALFRQLNAEGREKALGLLSE